eukprot:576425-Heterocapsa_arctica.AAC.1
MIIGDFLKHNRPERLKLASVGAIILTLKEAKEVIEEELTIAEHTMDSPRTETDSKIIISVVMDFDQDNPDERAALKFFKRCDVRDTAN